jgi:hypothetical protein
VDVGTSRHIVPKPGSLNGASIVVTTDFERRFAAWAEHLFNCICRPPNTSECAGNPSSDNLCTHMPIRICTHASWRAQYACRAYRQDKQHNPNGAIEQDHPHSHCALTSRRALGLAALVAFTTPLKLPAQAQEERIEVSEVKKRLERCFVDGQYYVSGNLDRGIFDPDCQFADPTIRVKGAESSRVLQKRGLSSPVMIGMYVHVHLAPREACRDRKVCIRCSQHLQSRDCACRSHQV